MVIQAKRGEAILYNVCSTPCAPTQKKCRNASCVLRHKMQKRQQVLLQVVSVAMHKREVSKMTNRATEACNFPGG